MALLLIIDDDVTFVKALQRTLRADYDVRTAQAESEVAALLSPPPDVALLDLRLNENDPEDQSGLDVLNLLHQQLPQMPVVMVTAYGDLDLAVECMKRGAVDFLQKGRAQPHEIKARLARALDHSRLSRKVTQLEHELRLIEPREIVGASTQMQEIKRFVEAISADGSATVLLRGESGTGKELIARAIHASGRRSQAPFVAVNLNALPTAMLEAELFGHEPGAFTDAQKRHLGYLEQAHGGVLFLDEIGDIEGAVQVKLLRFLEERDFQRLGSTTPIKVDVQIVTATNASLSNRVATGQFREDLYYRLKVHEISLPPLRERIEDVPLLVDHYLRLLRQNGKKVQGISAEALAALEAFPWPGNIRELKNAVEAAVFWLPLRGRDRIELEDLPSDVRAAGITPQQGQDGRIPGKSLMEEAGFDINVALARDELSYIEQGLQAAQGKKMEAWRLLGYNDRFALRRRVHTILGRYPDLGAEFPGLAADFDRRKTL